MDLSRAKTILILSFLALNLFLGFRLWQSPEFLRAGGGLTSEEAAHAEEMLSTAGYELLVTIPRQIPRLSLLHVSQPPVREESWPRSFWGEDVLGEAIYESGLILYSKGEESLEVAANGLVIFRSDKPTESQAGTDDNRPIVEKFMRDRHVWQENLRFDYNFREGELTCYRYLQSYQGLPLFTSYVECRVAEGHVRETRLYHIIPLGFSGKEIQVVSAAEAVDTFIQQQRINFKDKKIVDISLGYYSQDYDAERWEMVPVWRIAAADGAVFYVNAFTGEREPLEH